MSNNATKYALILSSLVLCSGAAASKNPTLDATIRDMIRQEVKAYHHQEEEALLKNIESVWNSVVPNKTVAHIINESGVEETHTNEGTGFVVGDKYITLDHVVSYYPDEIETPFGSIPSSVKRVEEKTYIDGVELISIEENPKTDIAVFQLPEELCKKYCNEGVPFSSDLYVGLDVFWIGNPGNSGKVLRYGKIGRTVLPADALLEGIEGAIGLSIYVIPGDSGSPVFNIKGELLGVVQFSQEFSEGSLGFFKPIDQFRPYLTSMNEPQQTENK